MNKIIVTSDLHVGYTPISAVSLMFERIRNLEPDAVVVAGDLAESFSSFVRCLQLFQSLQCPVAILAGNHDLWTQVRSAAELLTHFVDLRASGESASLFFEHLPEAVRGAGMWWLEDDSILLGNGVAICGSIAWYDYSRRQPATKVWTSEQFATAKPRLNNDGNFIRWGFSDPQFAECVGDGLIERLSRLEKSSEIRTIVVATHVPIYTKQLVSISGDDPVMDAYFANLSLGRRISTFEKVAQVVSGHTHREVLPGKLTSPQGRSITLSTVGSTYGRPGFLVFEV